MAHSEIPGLTKKLLLQRFSFFVTLFGVLPTYYDLMIQSTTFPKINKQQANSVVSIVAPVFNEAEGIRSFVDIVRAELDRLPYTWEIVLVDDGSIDSTWEILQTLHAEDSRVKILRFSRNFGNQAAVSAGLKFAQGDAVITMDSDLQHPPELIPKLIQHWQNGFQSVFTVRTYADDVSLLRKSIGKTFGKIMSYISQAPSQGGSSDFRLMDRKVIDSVNLMGENARFLRPMISWLGFRQTSFPFKMDPRAAGTTKFSFLKLCRLSLDGITSFSVLPLRWITVCGLAVAAMSLCYAIFVLGTVWLTGITTPGWTSLIMAILFLGGMQLTALGIVGEYVGRIYMETKRRPLFVLQDKTGFGAEIQAIPDASVADVEKAA
jgi:dolichol-phosphate mannosyltransferase